VLVELVQLVLFQEVQLLMLAEVVVIALKVMDQQQVAQVVVVQVEFVRLMGVQMQLLIQEAVAVVLTMDM
jgi:hypothetical protein